MVVLQTTALPLGYGTDGEPSSTAGGSGKPIRCAASAAAGGRRGGVMYWARATGERDVSVDEIEPERGGADERGVDFVLVTALEEERDAVLRKLGGHARLEKDGGDAHTYYEARLPTARSDGAAYRVIVTSIGGMGPIKGAAKAGDVVRRWQPAHVILVGIARGVRGEGELGDVVVATQGAEYT